MNTPTTSVSPTPALTDQATLDAALGCLLETIPIDMQGNHTPETLYEVLLWAASRHDTVNHASEVLEDVPSANDIRYHLRGIAAILNKMYLTKTIGQKEARNRCY